jgi:metal-responsive CopG/Arc/MetJ family transcriptional regulator
MGRRKMTINEKKKNVTLLVNENLLSKVDGIITETGDKRSRLIERLIIEYIEKKINKNE